MRPVALRAAPPIDVATKNLATPLPPLLGWAGAPWAAACRAQQGEAGVRVHPAPAHARKETPLPNWERGGEPGTPWVQEPG